MALPYVIQEWETQGVTLKVRSDKIIEYRFRPGRHVDLEEQKVITAHLLSLGRQKEYAMFIQYAEFTTVSHDAQRYGRNLEDESPLLGVAIITRSLPQRILANFYFKVFRPGIPTVMVKDEDEAIAWCHKQVEASGRKKAV